MRRRFTIAPLLFVLGFLPLPAEAYPIVWTFQGRFMEALDDDFGAFGIDGFDVGDPVRIVAVIDSAAPNLCGVDTGNGAYPLSSISADLNGTITTYTITPGFPDSAPGFLEVNAALGCGHFGGLVLRPSVPFAPMPPGYSLILAWNDFPGSTLQDAVDLAIPFGPPFASLRSGSGEIAEIAIEDLRIESLPEPSTLFLAGTGLVALAGAARRRRKRHASGTEMRQAQRSV